MIPIGQKLGFLGYRYTVLAMSSDEFARVWLKIERLEKWEGEVTIVKTCGENKQYSCLLLLFRPLLMKTVGPYCADC